MEAELEKLEANLGGVADMRRQPDAIFIVDLKKEALAVREAQRLHMPVIALVDTNCDPDEADFVIPGNDDAIRSCSLIVRAIADGIAAGQTKVSAKDFAAAAAPAAAEVERSDERRGSRGRRRARACRRARGCRAPSRRRRAAAEPSAGAGQPPTAARGCRSARGGGAGRGRRRGGRGGSA